jgi:hypothetical protein
MDRTSDPLKLAVLDEEDLEVVATHLQDAVVKVADVIWQPQARRLVIGLNRFDWEQAIADKPQNCRRRSALRFDRVQSFKCRSVDQAGKDGILNLLTVEFTETEAPSGVVTLIFSGDAALRLEVECLEAELVDLGPVWNCTGRPVHAVEAKD